MKFVDVRHSSHHCNSCGQAHRKYTNIIFRGWLLSIDKIRSLHPCHSFVSDEVFQIAMNLLFIHDIFHLGAMAIKRIWGCVAIFIVDVFMLSSLAWNLQENDYQRYLKSYSSALLISRYILRWGQRGRCCFCAACPNRKMYLEIRSADKGLKCKGPTLC